MRCYAPRISAIAALLLVGCLALRHLAGHAVGNVGLAANLAIILGGCLLAAGMIVVSAAVIRRRRAAAGACLTCRHPCQEGPDMRAGGTGRQFAPGASAPRWPHRPLTREPVNQSPAGPPRANRPALPVVVIARQAPRPDPESGARTRENVAR